MSDDLELAIAEGATMVRIGTAIFGARRKNQAGRMNVAMNVLFIGGGNMADALIGGMLKSGFAPGQLRAVEVDGAARRRLADKYRVECFDEVRRRAAPGRRGRVRRQAAADEGSARASRA